MCVCELAATYLTSCPFKIHFLHTEPRETSVQSIHLMPRCFLSYNLDEPKIYATQFIKTKEREK